MAKTVGLLTFNNLEEVTKEYIVKSGGIKMAPAKCLTREDKIDELFIDTSGFGARDEPALTLDQLLERLCKLLCEHGPIKVGITETGQFQAYIGIWPAKRKGN